jgi:cytochrome c-type biogenesis protein CcmH
VSTPEQARTLSRRSALRWLFAAPALTGCASLIRGDTPTEAERVYEMLMCTCGCNQLLGECNHVGCPNSVPMRAEADRYLADGHTADETVTMFVNKYGPSVRSAPPTEGWFNLSSWLAPFAALAAGAIGVAWYLSGMLARKTPPAAPSAATPSETSRRLEDELKDFTPED